MNTKMVLRLFVSALLFFAMVSCSEDTVIPDTILPRVSISQPTSGIVVSNEVPISVHAEDNEGILKIQFFIDDVLIAEDAEEPYNQIWYSGYWAGGEEYHIIAIAHDLNGNQKESTPILVTLEENSKYRPNLISPEEGQLYSDEAGFYSWRNFIIDYEWDPVPGARGYTLRIRIPGYELDYGLCDDGTNDVCFVWVSETTYSQRWPFNKCCYYTGIPIDGFVSVGAYWTAYLQSEWSEERRIIFYVEP